MPAARMRAVFAVVRGRFEVGLVVGSELSMSAPVDDTNTEGGREFSGRRGGSYRLSGSTVGEYHSSKYISQ